MTILPQLTHIIEAQDSEFGPCENCHHEECADDRELAMSECPFCKTPIGYDRKFTLNDERKWVHQECKQSDIDEAAKVQEKQYPELDKFAALASEIKGAFDILEWIEKSNLSIVIPDDLRYKNPYRPMRESMVYDCFGIDRARIEEEKKAKSQQRKESS